MRNRKNILFLFVIIFINLISLSGCFYSTPELVKKYEKQNVKIQNTKREEYSSIYVDDGYSFEFLDEVNEYDEEVTVIYIYKDSKLEYKKEYPRDYIRHYAGDEIVIDNILYFKVIIKEEEFTYSALMKYESQTLSIFHIFRNEIIENEIIENKDRYRYEILTNEYIYHVLSHEDKYDKTKYLRHFYVYDYNNTMVDEFIIEVINFDEIFKTNEGYLFVGSTGVYLYENNKLKLIDEYQFYEIEGVKYNRETNDLSFIGYNAEFNEKNYHVYYSHKKATYFSYNNGDIKELLSIEFPDDYYYRIHEMIVLENNLLVLIRLEENKIESKFERVMILNYDYEKIRCIYPNDSYYTIFKRGDYIVFWRSDFNMFTKKETYKYKKILIDDIINK